MRDELREMFEEIGEWDEVRAGAQKELLAEDIRRAMRTQKITMAEMARRMKTGRESVYRLLDPSRPGVTLDSIERAARALGMVLNISIAPVNQTAQRQRPKIARARKQKRAA
jgi:DNA-binding phage protein